MGSKYYIEHIPCATYYEVHLTHMKINRVTEQTSVVLESRKNFLGYSPSMNDICDI